jgi:glycogen operon protein
VAAGIFSYRVLWFEREGRGFKPPGSYPSQALACLASHDLPTFSGWRAGHDIAIAQAIGHLAAEDVPARKAARAEEVHMLERLTGCSGADEIAASAAAHRLVAATPSQIMLVQADDLGGESDPLNVPGTDREWPNWRRRVSVPVDDLCETPRARAILAAVKQERPE